MTPLLPRLRFALLLAGLALTGSCQLIRGSDASEPPSAFAQWRDRAHLLEAQRLMRVGDDAGAARELAAWEGADASPEGHWLRATLALRRGDEGAAAMALADGLARFPDDLDLVSLGARVAARRGDWETAIALDRRWVALRPQAAEPARQLVRALVLAGRLDEAAAVGDTAVQRFPGDWRLAALVGDAHFARGEYRHALRRWERAETAGWTGQHLQERRILALAALGDGEAGGRTAEKVGLDRLSPFLLAPVGGVALGIGKVGVAEEAFRRHLTLHPDDGEARLDLARAQFLAGDRRGAVASARRALRQGADPAAASLLEARGLVALGHVEAAADAYAMAVTAGASEEALRPELDHLQSLLGAATAVTAQAPRPAFGVPVR